MREKINPPSRTPNVCAICSNLLDRMEVPEADKPAAVAEARPAQPAQLRPAE